MVTYLYVRAYYNYKVTSCYSKCKPLLVLSSFAFYNEEDGISGPELRYGFSAAQKLILPLCASAFSHNNEEAAEVISALSSGAKHVDGAVVGGCELNSWFALHADHVH